MKIETDRLEMRQMHLWDTLALYTIFKHPEFFYAYTHQDNANLIFSSVKYAFLAEASHIVLPKQHKIMSVFLKNEEHMIGAAVLTDIKQTEEFGVQAEIGYFIDKLYQGNGYAFEAISGLIQHEKANGNLNSVWAVTDKDNIASQKTLEKIPLKQVGYEEKSQYKARNGETTSRYHYRGVI